MYTSDGVVVGQGEEAEGLEPEKRFSVCLCIYMSAYAISGHCYIRTWSTNDLYDKFHEHIGSI
jgi:hypothetical protein